MFASIAALTSTICSTMMPSPIQPIAVVSLYTAYINTATARAGRRPVCSYIAARESGTCARARAAGTLPSVARARDTRVRSLVELVFGTRLGPAQRSAARATQSGRRIRVHVLAAEYIWPVAGPWAASSGVGATMHATARAGRTTRRTAWRRARRPASPASMVPMQTRIRFMVNCEFFIKHPIS